MWSAVALPLLALVAPAVAQTYRDFWWNITYAEANPDGLFDRRVIGVNGTWPPPPLEVNEGEIIRLHAYNGLDTPTAIHHHGMFLPNMTYMDGAVGVTQCPIPPGATFTYEINTWIQSGTYWVHGHFSGQYVDGFRAPFLIHKPQEVYQYDEDITVILSDWYHQQHNDMAARFLSIANPGGAEPVPEAAIMYFSANGTYLPGFTENATLNFVPGRTYRLRVINMSALAMFWFWIDGHQLDLIEVDGTDIERTPVALQGISVAQRYSFLVTARNDTNSNFLIHANMEPSMFDGIPDTLQMNITSSVTYSSSAPMAPADPEFLDVYANSVDDYQLKPVIPAPIRMPDTIVPLNVFFDTYDNGVNRASFENITYQIPLVPSILTVLSTGSDAQNVRAYGPSAKVIQFGEVVELLVVNWDAGNHPFHLHGHKFAIVWKSFDVISPDPEINPPLYPDNNNPMWRDTIHIPSGGAVRIRFAADNPGAWFFHCHIDWHLTSGLAWAFIEAPDLMQQHIHPPQFIYDHCKALGWKIEGNAAGNKNVDDWTNMPQGPYPQVLGWTPKGIGAMFACVFSAVIGMVTVVWYALSGSA